MRKIYFTHVLSQFKIVASYLHAGMSDSCIKFKIIMFAMANLTLYPFGNNLILRQCLST